MNISDSPGQLPRRRAPSLGLRVGCALGIGLALIFVTAAVLLHGDAVKIMFGCIAVFVVAMTGVAWHYFRLPMGHDFPGSSQETEGEQR